MAKLPKNLRKSLQQGRAGAGGRGGAMGGMKGTPRNMRRMMDQMGIDLQEVPAQEVIIKCDEYDIVITSPQVSLVNQAGQEIYQVMGTSEKIPKGESTDLVAGELGEEPMASEAETEKEGPASLTPQTTPDDVKLVAAQAQVSESAAEAALKETNGNIAQAIINLRSKRNI